MSGTLSTGTGTSICASGCNASTTSPFCTTCGTNASGSCTEYELTETVVLPASSTITITITNAGCGASGTFDSSDEIIFRRFNAPEIVVPGNVSQTATRCFDNPSANPSSIVFGYRANRRDEFADWTYTISPGTGVGCLTLPVEFKSFSVSSVENNTVGIQFSTAAEINNAFFTIERSFDGSNFESIGEIQGALNSSRELSYTFKDHKPYQGINYYRIKQTDFDGKYDYSDIKSIKIGRNKIVQVSPLLTEGRLNIDTNLEVYDVNIYDASGKLVWTQTKLSAVQDIFINDLRSGIYFVRVNTGSNVETFRIMKR
jgi:Secretion system C-terminal sorting domain